MTSLTERFVNNLKTTVVREFVDPTYKMSNDQKRHYYRNKETHEQREHEARIARINAHQFVHQTYENRTRRY
jgi:hypothetical protein